MIKKKNISVANFLYSHSPKLLIFAVFLGALSGFLYSLIIPSVLHQLNSGEGNTRSFLFVKGLSSELFFTLCFLILCTKAFSTILVNNIAKSAAAELKIKIAKKINLMMTSDVEEFGLSRLITILTEDIANLSSGAIAIPMLFVSSLTVVGMLGYLAFLNLYIFIIVFFSIFIGVLIFKIPVALASGLYRKARLLRDLVQESTRGLVLGVYELKLNKIKSKAYIEDELIKPQDESVKLEKIGDAVLHVAGASSDMLSFFIIGLIVFVLPYYLSLPASESYGIVMALLYIAGPVGIILSMMQHLKVAQIALGHIQDLNEFEEDFIVESSSSIETWNDFSLENISYKYPSSTADKPFSLQKINLSFKPGQINFIVGGNGSGKTTLGKLISLHYIPTSGRIRFGESNVCAKNLSHAREKISVIFSNYYLFRKIHVDPHSIDEIKIDYYLDIFGLSEKTKFIDGGFTTTKLSDGQRRRLALLVALLEDKDIYVFDEWAADQDPEFKKIFYRQVIQEMKRMNKLVVVITHDDRYFDCADRVIVMESGNLVEIRELHAIPMV